MAGLREGRRIRRRVGFLSSMKGAPSKERFWRIIFRRRFLPGTVVSWARSGAQV